MAGLRTIFIAYKGFARIATLHYCLQKLRTQTYTKRTQHTEFRLDIGHQESDASYSIGPTGPVITHCRQIHLTQWHKD